MIIAVISVDFNDDLTCRELCCIVFDERFSYSKSYIRKISDIIPPGSLTAQDILARELNDFLRETNKIFVWDKSSEDALIKLFSCCNDYNRHIAIISTSSYNPYKNMSLSELSEQSIIDMTNAETTDEPLSQQKMLCTAYYKLILEICGRNKQLVCSNSETVLAKKTAAPVHINVLREITEFCRENNMICRIDHNNIVFIKTNIAEWYFEINPGKIRLHHENFRRQKGAEKYGEGFHIQKQEFDDPLSAVKYIHKHDTFKSKRFW